MSLSIAIIIVIKFLGGGYIQQAWVSLSIVNGPLCPEDKSTHTHTHTHIQCGETKTTRKNKVKKKPWHWDSIHQIAFDNVKTTIAKEVVLAYPDFTKPFEIYTSASTKQLGAVTTQENRPIAFFSRKLSGAQSKYRITKLELLPLWKH